MNEKDLDNQNEQQPDNPDESKSAEEKAKAEAPAEEAKEAAAEEETEESKTKASTESPAEAKQPEPTEEKEAEVTGEKKEDKAADVAEEKKEEVGKVEASKEAIKEGAPKAEPNGKHDEFNWDGDETKSGSYTDKERDTMTTDYENTLNEIVENEIISGTVVAITDSEVVLNIGFKSDGLVSLSEFRDLPDLAEGEEVEVYVVEKEDPKGQLVLSRKNAKLMRAWEHIVNAHDKDEIVTGRVISKTKGGLIADVFGLETFLPGSQIDVKPIIDYDSYVGKTMEFKVVKINEAIKNAVVSHKALIESDLETQRQEIISKLEKGQILEGVIKNITDFGAFIDLGGVDGLLYITDISWGRINHPSEILELNQKLNVVVLDFDDDKKRISLGLKQLTDHPWDTLGADLKETSKVKGKIVNIEDYGAFLEITPGVEGLIHVSEVSWSNQPINSKEFFTLGDEYEAIIVTIDREERKMSLSIKQLSEDPWNKIAEKYAKETRHTGLVKNLTPYGVFIEFEEGVGGMIHVSDLSWTKRFQHPSEFTKPGDNLEIVVLEIDGESRKLTLGHKQIEEDPWDTFQTVFIEGSVHQGTILRVEDKGAVVMMQYGLEVFAPIKHIKKEDGNNAVADETLDFKILEFDKGDRKVIVSHTKIIQEQKQEKEGPATAAPKKRASAKAAPKKPAPKRVEKTTLGDLSALSDLKDLMEAEAKGKTVEKPKAPKKATVTKEEAGVEAPKKETDAKAEEPKAATEAPKEEADAKAEDAKAAMETPKEEADAKAEDAKAASDAPKEKTDAKAEEPKAAAEDPKEKTDAKAKEPKAEGEVSKDETDAKAEKPKIEAEAPKEETDAKAKEPKAETPDEKAKEEESKEDEEKKKDK